MSESIQYEGVYYCGNCAESEVSSPINEEELKTILGSFEYTGFLGMPYFPKYRVHACGSGEDIGVLHLVRFQPVKEPTDAHE